MQIEQRPFHVYNVSNGAELGTVKEFDQEGALKWASFLFDTPRESLAVSETPVSPQSLALRRTH
ncbi:hypothetical protein [Burkholderia phage vB_BglM_WTB]